MTPVEKQELWNAILKLRNMPYTGSGYAAYNNVKNPALRGGKYYWMYPDMRELYEQLVKYCELGESEACWRVLLGYKNKIYPAYLRKIYQSLNCTPAPTCPAIGDTWHGGIVFFIDGNDYYIAEPNDFEPMNLWSMCNAIGFNVGTGSDIQSSYNNTLLLEPAPCGPALASEALNVAQYGYSDWFLPSIEALEMMDSLGLGLLNPKTNYWSSSEDGFNDMFCYDTGVSRNSFIKGDVGPSAKRIRKETCI